jgi:DNA-binding GntR family transcriptional regulator
MAKNIVLDSDSAADTATAKTARADLALNAIARGYHTRMRVEASPADSLSDGVVVPTLREAIVEGLLTPGSRLSEVHLARQLDVSRTPMREAFVQLEREGLVTVVARVGAFVRAVTSRDVDEIYTVRAALESLAVQLAAKHITPLARAQLDDVTASMQNCVERDDPVAYVEQLDRFYTVVMTLADNTTLQHTHATLLGPVRRLRRIAMARGGRMRASFEQTLKIKAAIFADDAEVAVLMRQQLANACQAAKDVLSSSGAH